MQDGANRLSAATLTHSDIQNRADYRGSSLGIGGGYSVGNGGMMPIGGSGGAGGATAGGVGTNQQGQASTGAGKVPGSNLPSSGNWSATPPVVMGASGSAGSTTGSGISGGALRITGESRQQAHRATAHPVCSVAPVDGAPDIDGCGGHKCVRCGPNQGLMRH